MRAKFQKISTMALVLALSGAPAISGQVELRSPDGATTLDGDLISYDEKYFFLKVGANEIRLDRSKVECVGESCPQENAEIVVDFNVRGSDTIGDELMPLLVKGYAESQGATIGRKVETGPDTIAMALKGGSKADGLVVQVQAAGSSTGFKALITEETDIAMSSRPARAKEISAVSAQGRGNIVDLSQEYIIAVDSILAVVSPDNPVDQMGLDQLGRVFSGQITNWKELGGPDMPITVVTRPETSGTRGVFEKAVLAPVGGKMRADAVVLGSNHEITGYVAANPGAIGYAGFAYKDDTKGVNLVSSCGIPMNATAFTAKTEEYPLQRRLRLFVDNGRLPEHVKGLLDFAISEKADEYVHEAGFIDLSVEAAQPGIDTAQVIKQANLNGEAAAFNAMGDMFETLGTATRLSTTFRFVSGSAQMDNKSLRDLSRMAEFLAKSENRGREVIVAGFTDNVGDFAYNAGLSERRASTIAAALRNEAKKHGLSNLTMRSVGFSEMAPVGCNDNDLGKYRNRRVEIWIR